MLQNNIELDLKTKLIESGTTQTEVAEKVGVSLAYVNRITKGREQIVNKTFVKMMDELEAFLEGQQEPVTDYDEGLVRKLIERITVYDGYLAFEFKCGLETEVQM